VEERLTLEEDDDLLEEAEAEAEEEEEEEAEGEGEAEEEEEAEGEEEEDDEEALLEEARTFWARLTRSSFSIQSEVSTLFVAKKSFKSLTDHLLGS
jgi:hypothetical protein